MRNRFLRGLIPALLLAAMPALSSAGLFVGVSVNIAPPPLPVYVQPACPEPGYLWVPGYWAWSDGAYYWVPGTWVLPPEVGLLWTPGWWGWNDDDDDYVWHAGYWGPHVGFYGGVDYGYGYDGEGFEGGYWRGSQFYYNRAVVHVGPTIVNNYYHTVVYNNTYEHVSYNGGRGGVVAHPTRGQMLAEREPHIGFTPVQQRQQRMAFADPSLRADRNHGRPPVAATARPAVFHGSNVIPARAAGGPVHYTPSHNTMVTRSDRPSWATGQNRAGRPMERGAPMHGQAPFERPQQQPRFESRPQGNFEQRGSRPMDRLPSRSQPEYRQEQRPQRPPEYRQEFRAPSQPAYRQEYRAPSQPEYRPEFRQQPQSRPEFRPEQGGPAMRGPPPREQPRGGERPQPNRPPENRGGRGR
jgi:YXWGXW repeat-containing protein